VTTEAPVPSNLRDRWWRRVRGNGCRVTTVASAAAQPLDRPPQRFRDATGAARLRTSTPSPNASAARGSETTQQRTQRGDRRARCSLTAWRPAAPRPPRNRGRAPTHEPVDRRRAPTDEAANRRRTTAAATAPAKPRSRTQHPAPRARLNGRRATTDAPAAPTELTARGAATARQRTPRNHRRVHPRRTT